MKKTKKVMFVLHAIDTPGGLEVVEIIKANSLVEKGIEVIILVRNRKSEWTPRPLSEKVKVLEFGENMPSPYKLGGMSFLMYIVKFRKCIQSIIESEKPDVLVGTGMDNKWVIPFVKYPKGHKMIKVREYHLGSKTNLVKANSLKQRTMARMVNFLEQRLLSHMYDRMFLLTYADKKDNHANDDRFDVMHNPLCLDLKNINPGGREKSVLFVGRLCDKDKNISGLLRIWAKTNKDGWTLKLVGDGEDKQYLEDYAKQLGVSSSVEFVGWVDTPMEIMTTSSLFCMTSHIEGFALVLIEAMACGLPVVSYDLPYGPSDIITDGIDGYLIPNGDEQVFADRLSQCLANEDRIAPMSVAAIEKSKQFDVDTITDLWIKKYNELLSSKG